LGLRRKRIKLSMNKEEYKDYLQSDHWKGYRGYVLDFWNNECGLCRYPAKDVHHRRYDRLGAEELTDCIPLCRSCHTKHHTTLKETAIETFKQITDIMFTLIAKRDAINDENGGCFDKGMPYHIQYCDVKEKRHKLGKVLKNICTDEEYNKLWRYPYR